MAAPILASIFSVEITQTLMAAPTSSIARFTSKTQEDDRKVEATEGLLLKTNGVCLARVCVKLNLDH